MLVKTSELTFKVYGPYTTFKHAEGDAKAWEGSVELVLPKSSHETDVAP